MAELVACLADDRRLEALSIVGFSGGGPYALACGALLADRVSRVAAVSSWGPIDELEAASGSLTDDERGLVAAIRAAPERATELLWAAGQWYADTPLRFLETTPEVADERVLNDPAVLSNLTDSNLEGSRQGQAGLIGDWIADALPWGFRLADVAVPVELWVGERDPGRAPMDASEICRSIPACTLHSDVEAGHWLVVSRWADIVESCLA